MTNLPKKGAKLMWTEACECAFAGMKVILVCELVLLDTHLNAPFKLAVDACNTGIGAVLLQVDAAISKRYLLGKGTIKYDSKEAKPECQPTQFLV